MPSLNKLNPEDIDEKIRINHKDGVDIWALYQALKEEYKDCKWVELRSKVQCQILADEILELELKSDNPNIKGLIRQKQEEISKFRGQEITSCVQCQFYIEQIEHIEKRIKEIADRDNPFGADNYADKLIPALLLK